MTPPTNISSKQILVSSTPLSKQEPNIVTPPKTNHSNKHEPNIVTPLKTNPLTNSESKKNLWLFERFCIDQLTEYQIESFNKPENKYTNSQS